MLLNAASTLFVATTKETAKEVSRPKAASFLVAMKRVDVALNSTIVCVSVKLDRLSVGRKGRIGWMVGLTDGPSVGQVEMTGTLCERSWLEFATWFTDCCFPRKNVEEYS